ncbi:MAG: efflux RND transporter periplasmic adaptor subunit [Dissulfuribacterales bacterium]
MKRMFGYKSFFVLIVVCAAGFLGYRMFLYRTPVEMVQVRTGKVQEYVGGPGVLEARIPVNVSGRITSQIVWLGADVGDRVKRGDLLVRLERSELMAKLNQAREGVTVARRNIYLAETGRSKAQADLDLARDNYLRDLKVFKAGYISQAAMDASTAQLRVAESAMHAADALLSVRHAEHRKANEDVANAEAVLAYTEITAPMDGVVVSRLREIGDTVMPGTPVFQIVDENTLWVKARIDETVVGKVRQGQPAVIALRTGGIFNGRVERVERQSDKATRELEVAVSFEQPPLEFAIDQEAEVRILTGEADGLVIPSVSMFYKNGKPAVLVLKDGRSFLQPVKIGLKGENAVQVLEGLRSGDSLVKHPERFSVGERIQPIPFKNVS